MKTWTPWFKEHHDALVASSVPRFTYSNSAIWNHLVLLLVSLAVFASSAICAQPRDDAACKLPPTAFLGADDNQQLCTLLGAEPHHATDGQIVAVLDVKHGSALREVVLRYELATELSLPLVTSAHFEFVGGQWQSRNRIRTIRGVQLRAARGYQLTPLEALTAAHVAEKAASRFQARGVIKFERGFLVVGRRRADDWSVALSSSYALLSSKRAEGGLE